MISLMVAATVANTASQTNIIFIMADDMGYGDVGCYNPNSKIPTPNMDRLAAQGVRFTDAHSPDAVCTPTRYAVLTGRYCWRTWLQKNVIGGYTEPLINPERTTVGSYLQKHGYATACIGKWHLGVGWTRENGYVGHWQEQPRYNAWQDGKAEGGHNVDFTQPVNGGPADLGFDYSFYTAACSTIDGPFCYIENRHTVGLPNKPLNVDESIHPDYRPRPGLMADGFDVTNVDTDFTKKSIEFIEKHRQNTPEKPFFLYLALSSPHAPWLPPAFTKGKSDEGPRGDLVVWADWAVGQITETLERLKIADNTLIILTSDNGPRQGLNGHTSSGNFRGYKSHIWEGGHRVPFIARWPGKIKRASTCDEPICTVDLMATCAAIIGDELPIEVGPDSINILPAMLDQKLSRPLHQAIIHHSCYGVFSVRSGTWKLILDTKKSGGWVEPDGENPVPGSPGQLYNMETDPYETNDLWEKHPDIVEKLTALLEKYKNQGHSRYE